MAAEHRFVLADFSWLGRDDRLHAYEAGKHYPMPPVVAHAVAKCELVAKGKPPRWERPSILTPPEVLSEIEVAEAEAELRALNRHAIALAALVANGWTRTATPCPAACALVGCTVPCACCWLADQGCFQ